MPDTSIVPYHYHDANVDRIKNEITDNIKNYSLDKMNSLKKKYAKEIEGQNFKILDYEKSFRKEKWYTNLNAVQRRDVEYQIVEHIHKTVYKYLPNIYEPYNSGIVEKYKAKGILLNLVEHFKEKIGFIPSDPKTLKKNCAGFANFAGEIYKMYGYEIREFNIPGHTAIGVRINREQFISDVNFNELKPIRDWVEEMKSWKWISDASNISHYGGVSDASVHFNLGHMYDDLNQHKKAEKEYKEAIKINPNLAGVHNNLGNLLVDLERYDEAEKEYREAIKINPNNTEAHNNLGILLQNLNRYEDAKKEYKEAIKINPNYADAHYNLGSLLYNLKRYIEAKNEFRQALLIQLENEDLIADAQKNLDVVLEKLNENTYPLAIRSRPLIIILIFLGIIATLLVVLALLSHPSIDVFAILGSWLK